jgi:CheY-like chemotaxis protein
MVHTVLIIDDDADACETLREFLEGEGYAVECAHDGVEGLAKAAKIDHLCVVLLDLFMPRMNGWDFFDAFKAQPKFASIPVAVITSAPDRAPPGATRVLTKPLGLSPVLGTVAEYC